LSVDLKAMNKLKTLHQSPIKSSHTTYMDNWLREFEELLLNNVLFKVQNQVLVDKIQNGMNGGRPYKRSRRNKLKIIWNLLVQTKRRTFEQIGHLQVEVPRIYI